MLTKKHYIAIGHIFATLPIGPSPLVYKDNLAEALAQYFTKDNPNFDPDKFYNACHGIKKGGRDAKV